MVMAAVILAVGTGASPQQLFPMSLNSTWLYQRQWSVGTKSVGYAVTVIKKNAAPVGVTWEMSTSDAKDGAKTVYKVDDSGVFVVSEGAPPIPTTPPRPILVAPLTPGKSWKWSGSLAGQVVPAQCRMESKVAPSETIVVLGKPVECLKIESKIWFGKGRDEIKSERTSWYAPNIGLVQEMTTYTMKRDRSTCLDTLSAYVAGKDK